MVVGTFAFLVFGFLIYLLVKAVDPGRVTVGDDPGFVDLVMNNLWS